MNFFLLCSAFLFAVCLPFVLILDAMLLLFILFVCVCWALTIRGFFRCVPAAIAAACVAALRASVAAGAAFAAAAAAGCWWWWGLFVFVCGFGAERQRRQKLRRSGAETSSSKQSSRD